MTEAARQRRLHVENRLEELRSRHGRDIEGAPMPAWLDSMEGFRSDGGLSDQPESQAPVRLSPLANGGAVPGRASNTPVSKPPVLRNDAPLADFTDLDV